METQIQRCKLAVRDGLRYLRAGQLSTGEFPVLAWLEQESPASGEVQGCTFGTSLVLYSLRRIKRHGLAIPENARKEGENFLLRNMKDIGLFSYYSTTEGDNLPVDLDDTCCASYVLQNRHPYLSWHANAKRLASNRNRNGIFLTWIEPFEGPNNVDLGVNANVIMYLGEREETRAACDFISQVLMSNNARNYSIYYPNIFVLAYLVCRAQREAARLRPAVKFLARCLWSEQQSDGSFGTDLDTACAIAIAAESRLDFLKFSGAVDALCASQRVDGSWATEALYRSYDHSFGHETLTTAVCLDALISVLGAFDR